MMEVGSQKVQNAASGDRWSSSSSQYPSCRFPKVSIGITVEKGLRSGPGPRNEDASVLPGGDKTISCQVAGETTKPGMVETLERNRSDDVAHHTASAWFSTRSTRVETLTAEGLEFFVNGASVLQSEDGHKKSNTLAYGKRKKGGDAERVEVALATLQNTRFVNKGSAREEPVRTINSKERRVNTLTYGKKREKDGYAERAEEVAFSTKHLFHEKKGTEHESVGPCNNKALRTKLCEILGNTTPENKHATDSPKTTEYRESLNITQSRENQKDKVTRAELNTLVMQIDKTTRAKLNALGNQKDEVTRAKLNSPSLEKNKENLNINQCMEYKKGNDGRVKLKSRQLEESKENFTTNKSRQSQKRKAARTKQNSDTIETDSESPNQVSRRPVTRSLTLKKASPKRIQKFQDNASCVKKPLSSASSDFKLRVEKKNGFELDEVEENTRSLGHTSNGHSNHSKERSNTKVELRKVHFPRSVSESSLQNNGKEPSSVPADKASPQSKDKANSSVSCQDKKQSLQMQDGARNDGHRLQRAERPNFGSPLQAYSRGTRENTDSPLFKWGHENSPPVRKTGFLCEDAACPSVGRETDQLREFHSPTLAMDMSPTSPTMRCHTVLSSPLAACPIKSTPRDYSSKDLNDSTPASCQPNANSESDGTREIHKAGNVNSRGMKDEEKWFSLYAVEELDTESDADDLTSQGLGMADKWIPRTGNPTKSPLSIRHSNRLKNLNNVKSSKTDPSSPSPDDTISTEELLGSHEALELDAEGSLGRCIAQLAWVLERFKKKVKSRTNKSMSDVLSTAAEKIRQQLQDVESQILADVGKFNNVSNSKRKRLESKFQEQQERFKFIHDKFKEEVKQHLLDSRSIIEELDSCNIEFKGEADRQKAAHRKLILQVEEAAAAQINSAETSIAAIRKEAHKRTTGLKRALKEWMD